MLFDYSERIHNTERIHNMNTDNHHPPKPKGKIINKVYKFKKTSHISTCTMSSHIRSWTLWGTILLLLSSPKPSLPCSPLPQPYTCHRQFFSSKSEHSCSTTIVTEIIKFTAPWWISPYTTKTKEKRKKKSCIIQIIRLLSVNEMKTRKHIKNFWTKRNAEYISQDHWLMGQKEGHNLLLQLETESLLKFHTLVNSKLTVFIQSTQRYWGMKFLVPYIRSTWILMFFVLLFKLAYNVKKKNTEKVQITMTNWQRSWNWTH